MKLADYGVARQLDHSLDVANTVTGSILYSAPEVLVADPEYARPADIWSVGVVLYELCMLRLPFPDLRAIYGDQLQYPKINEDKYSSDLRSLIYRCLSRDP